MKNKPAFKIIQDGSVTSPSGFLAHGFYCGLKRSGKPDISLIYSQQPCTVAAVYTKNSIKAAPLIVTKNHLKKNRAQAVIANSGNANCFTGDFGLLYAKQTAECVANLLNIKPTDVIVASTGIIGKPLPYDKISAACPTLVENLSRDGGNLAAQGILTTDTFTKEIAVQFTLSGKKVTIGACAKGSGMIAPDMATMLGFITTDAAISSPMLKLALKMATERSFNSISVDGCISTNDMVTVMANQLAKNPSIITPNADFKIFYSALEHVCRDLAKKIVLDGEGATKFIEIIVNGAKTEKMAKKVALAVANSALVKTAAFGSNPNWGRVAAAVGSVGLPVTEKDLKISFSPFTNKDITITVDMTLGKSSATVYTCDLSFDYVTINGKYN